MTRPVIALLTDFGTQDHYVGAMKGVVLGICPEATLVDITHDVAPQDILGGALELAAAFKYFPPGTVFLCVVDPGVGSSRRGIAAAAGGFLFVAPDNGVLSAVFLETSLPAVVDVSNPRYARPTISRTFEGRDRFAPAAAWLAAGTPMSALGPSLDSWQTILLPAPRIEGARLFGEVLRVDRFGNLVTNIDRATFQRFAASASVDIAIAGHPVPNIVATYSDGKSGFLSALFGSGEQLEVATPGGSAAARLGVARGAPVVITRAA